jgi:hypothetical protein
MGTQYKTLSDKDQEFIATQQIFFVASGSGKEINLSPKGLDAIRVTDGSTLLFLDYPGSANRTERDIAAGGEVTIMWCAFTGPPRILRAFCRGEIIGKPDSRFADYLSRFGDIDPRRVRQIFTLSIYAVESSCGFGVPLYTFEQERNELVDWQKKMVASDKLDQYIIDHSDPPDLTTL